MGLGVFFRAFDRAAAKLNAWFAPAAIAANVEQSGLPAVVDPLRVKAILGEIEQERDCKGDDEEKPRD